MTACESCGDAVANDAARYCSNACRQRAYRQRNRSAPTEPSREGDVFHPLDGFVGREDELTGVTRLLRHGRLITLLGPAGAGKSRVAAELAGRVRRRFADGVWLVDLGGLTQSAQASQVVAAAMGVTEEPGRDLVDGLVARLRGADALLVLDNCEHLVGPCGDLVVRLLRRCGGLRVLATSREMLRLPGEMIFPVGELPLPDAVRLFVDRARAVAPCFEVTDSAAVELICTRLDCMPLAVELAARLVRVLSLAEISAGLDDRFTMLASTTKDARHSDLCAAIAWSYSLLDPEEQAVFRRLSVLPGGFGIELASVVGGATVPLVSTLESKSVIAPIPDRVGRFRQLESIRCYAGRMLELSGERAEVLERLVAWLTSLATPLTTSFATSGEVLDRLLAELPNLLAAVDFLRGSSDDRQLLLVSALLRCRQRLGIAADGRERLAAVLASVPDGSVVYRAYALEQASWMAAWHGDERAALDFARQAVELGSSHGSAALLSRALQAQAFARQVRGDHGAARESFAECLRHVRGLDEPMCVALCLNNLAWAQLLDGDLSGAAASVAEALPLYRAHAEPERQAALLHTTGVLALLRDQEAAPHFKEALENSSSVIQPYAVEGLAVCALRRRDFDRGLRLMGFAASVRSGTGDPWWRSFVSDALAEASTRLPARRVDALLADGRSVTPDEGVRYALGGVWPSARASDDSSLTGRQLGVAALLVEGLTNRQIAGRLRISERTVETHLDHIRTKLDLRSRAQVAAWAATRVNAP